MGSNRAKRGMTLRAIERQAGITVIGFLLLAAVFGIVGLALLKIVPLYLEKMRIGTVLEDLKTETSAGGNTAAGIRYTLDNRFYIENVDIKDDEIEISLEGDGYMVRINRESRASFFADLWFVLEIKEQVEIAR